MLGSTDGSGMLCCSGSEQPYLAPSSLQLPRCSTLGPGALRKLLHCLRAFPIAPIHPAAHVLQPIAHCTTVTHHQCAHTLHMHMLSESLLNSHFQVFVPAVSFSTHPSTSTPVEDAAPPGVQPILWSQWKDQCNAPHPEMLP